MSKEYLGALEIIYNNAKMDRNRIEQGYPLTYAEEIEHNERIKPYYDTAKQALQRLEQIDNTIVICKKANEQKYVYIRESYGIIKEKFLDNLDYEVLNNRLYVNSRGMYYDFPLKDYGVWWALTKEELENE